MKVVHDMYKQKLTDLLNDLAEPQLREVYHFTVFVKERFADELVVKKKQGAGADSLSSLVGIAALGGDALQDTEDLYYE